MARFLIGVLTIYGFFAPFGGMVLTFYGLEREALLVLCGGVGVLVVWFVILFRAIEKVF